MLKNTNFQWDNLTMLIDACCYKNMMGAKLLLSGNYTESILSMVIRDAAVFGVTELVEMLLKDERVDPSIYGECAVQISCCSGYYDIVKLLIGDERIKLKYRQRAISLAMHHSKFENINLLNNDSRIVKLLEI